MEYNLEVREGGWYATKDVFGKPLAWKIKHGCHVLYQDEAGVLQFGFVQQVDLQQQTLAVFDDVLYPKAPSPLGAQPMMIPFSGALTASNGFSGRRVDIYEQTDRGSRKLGERLIHLLDESVGLGFVEQRGGKRAYVVFQDERWVLRQ